MADQVSSAEPLRWRPIGFGLAFAAGLLVVVGLSISYPMPVAGGVIQLLAIVLAIAACGLALAPDRAKGVSGVALLGAVGLAAVGAVASFFVMMPLFGLPVPIALMAFLPGWARTGGRVGSRVSTFIALAAVVIGGTIAVALAAYEAVVVAPPLLIRDPDIVPDAEYLEAAAARGTVWIVFALINLGILVSAVSLVAIVRPARIHWLEVVVVGLSLTGLTFAILDTGTWDTGGDLSNSPTLPVDYAWSRLRSGFGVVVFAAAAVLAGLTVSVKSATAVR